MQDFLDCRTAYRILKYKTLGVCVAQRNRLHSFFQLQTIRLSSIQLGKRSSLKTLNGELLTLRSRPR
jgi:hypothetical protein